MRRGQPFWTARAFARALTPPGSPSTLAQAGEYGPPSSKTATSRRAVSLSPETVAAFKQVRPSAVARVDGVVAEAAVDDVGAGTQPAPDGSPSRS